MILETLLALLKDSETETAYVIENRCQMEVPTLPRNTTEFPPVDAMIITDLLHAQQIQKKLEGRVPFPVISAEEVLEDKPPRLSSV